MDFNTALTISAKAVRRNRREQSLANHKDKSADIANVAPLI